MFTTGVPGLGFRTTGPPTALFLMYTSHGIGQIECRNSYYLHIPSSSENRQDCDIVRLKCTEATTITLITKRKGCVYTQQRQEQEFECFTAFGLTYNITIN